MAAHQETAASLSFMYEKVPYTIHITLSDAPMVRHTGVAKV